MRMSLKGPRLLQRRLPGRRHLRRNQQNLPRNKSGHKKYKKHKISVLFVPFCGFLQRMELRIAEIMRILPHRYPFLLVDRVLEVDPDKRIVALKNVTINEPFFSGHFPGAPVMPGVLTIESMAQTGAILGLLEKNADLSKTLVYFMGIDEAKFRRPIVPGDQMRIVVEVIRRKAIVWKMKGEVYVGSELAAEAILLSSIGQQP